MRTPPQFSLFTLKTENMTTNRVITLMTESSLKDIHLLPNSFILEHRKRSECTFLLLQKRKHKILLQAPEIRKDLNLKEEKYANTHIKPPKNK